MLRSSSKSQRVKPTTKSTTKRRTNGTKKSQPQHSQKRTMSAKKLTVILTQDFDELGKAGDLVAVKPGRARNHLLPKGIVSYDTPQNRRELSSRGIDVKDVVIDKEEELKAAATRPYPVVLGDVIRNINWDFNREPVSSADNHIRKPVTKHELLVRFRDAKFFFIDESDIEISPGYDTLNHCGTWPCAVALHCADTSDWAHFEVNINRLEVKKDANEGDENAV